MIIRASFDNVLSFDKETSISFVASKSDALPAHVSRAVLRDDISVLKMGLIYGANGSGKSNVIKCIESLRDFAVFGSPKVLLEPFKLSASLRSTSNIEIEFKVEDKYYAYGIAYNKQRLVEEWLFQIGSRGGNYIFKRVVTDEENEIKFSASFFMLLLRILNFFLFWQMERLKTKLFYPNTYSVMGKVLMPYEKFTSGFFECKLFSPVLAIGILQSVC